MPTASISSIPTGKRWSDRKRRPSYRGRHLPQGAAALQKVGLGLNRDTVFVVDSKGVIREGRGDKLDESKQRYCQQTEAKTLADVVAGADVFLGCSAAGVLTPEAAALDVAAATADSLASNPSTEAAPALAQASANPP